MKQNITSEQMNELSIVGKTKLCRWCKGKFSLKKDEAKRLSIGDMVEFLYESRKHYWNMEIGNYPNSEIHPGQLCDYLWEACKEILERD